MNVFFSVGEPSGDLHGANLIRALRSRHPEWNFTGYGGPKMAAAGCELHADLTQFAVMWVAQVFAHLRTFLRLLAQADKYFSEERPDVVVLIDYPGFNWWIARKAKKWNIPVVYYGTPQLWAWASWRVRKMRRFVDHVLCKLPFEEPWFSQRGCHATFVGHPYFDELADRKLDQPFLQRMRHDERPLVTILPGSRTQEVKGNLATFLRAARRIQQRLPHVRFAIAAYKENHRGLAEELVHLSGLEVEVHVGRTPELIEAAHCCLACSGSVSLELLYHERPAAILYQVSRFGYLVQGVFRKVRYITLVNLLTARNPFVQGWAGRYDSQDPQDAHVLMPEYLTCSDRSRELAAHVMDWLTVPEEYQRVVDGMKDLKRRVGHGGASQRAADYISACLQDGSNNHHVTDAA